jgi:hypothetical protein
MRKKRKVAQKVRPQKQLAQVSLEVPPFHITFPITLHHKSENKFCYFSDEMHLQKYMERCNLKLKDVKVTKTKPKDET